MKKIVINTDQCLCCGSCVGLDEEHFKFIDGRFPGVISNENLDSNNLNNAICSCPTEAISIIEVDDNNNEEADNNSCQPNNKDECNCGDNCECGDNCNCGEKCCCHNN